MSKSELKEEKKKRKRQEDESEEVTKKAKKSKKSKEPTAEETPLVEDKKKDKKDKKLKKRKDSGEDASIGEASAKVKKEKRDKKSKKSKKSNENGTSQSAQKNGDVKDTTVEEDFIKFGDEPMPDASVEAAEKKDKKKSKKDKKSKTATERPETEVTVIEKKDGKSSEIEGAQPKEQPLAEEDPTAGTNGADELKEEDAEAIAEATSGKKDRFIVFVGNLPYAATKEQIEAHFAKLEPTAIRLRTYKNGHFMGTCFVEFDRFDRMQTCLKKYHHSIFPDEKRKEGRKINVELSAGGGGNNPTRKAKIQAKNDKLANERHRDHEKRFELESKQKERKAKKDARQNKGNEIMDEADEPAADVPVADQSGMHPARLAMMQRGGGRTRF